MKITQAEFFLLPEVLKLTRIQMQSPFNSEASRNARIKLREIAAQYGVEQFFGPLE